MATYLPDWRLDVLHWLAGAGIARLCDEHRPRECTVGWEHSDRWPTRLVITGATLEELASWIKERAPDPLDHHGEDPRRAHGGRVLIGGAQTTRGTVEEMITSVISASRPWCARKTTLASGAPRISARLPPARGARRCARLLA